MKKALITGITGQDGSYLAELLLEKGYEVHGIKRRASSFNTSRIDHLYQDVHENSNFKLHYGDLSDSSNLIKLVHDIEPDEIYNLACPASPVHYQKDPIQTIKTNFFGALNTLELAKKTGAKILQASTSEVYGNPLIHPQTENYFGNVNINGIRSCYDEGKRIAETLFCDYQRKYNLDIKIVRIFNTYGENMLENDGRVVSNFIVQALKNEDITLFGNGEQTRSFCYVEDLINGILKLMAKDNFNQPINLGNDEEYSVLHLAKTIIKLTNSNSKIVFKPLPSDDPVKRRPDLTLARKVLGYEFKTKLDDGLKKTIAYFTKKLKEKN